MTVRVIISPTGRPVSGRTDGLVRSDSSRLAKLVVITVSSLTGVGPVLAEKKMTRVISTSV